MRILYIQETDWLGKGPQQQHHILERLSNLGHQITVIDYKIDWDKNVGFNILSSRIYIQSPPKACDKCNIRLIRPKFIQLPILNYISLVLTYGKEIYYQIKKFQPDIIMGGGVLTVFLACYIAKKKNIPFIYNLVDKNHQLIPQIFLRPLGFAIEKLIHRFSSYVIAINEQLKNYSIRMGSNPSKSFVIRAGVESQLFHNNSESAKKIREKFGFNQDDLILFFMGWFYVFSGLDKVIERMHEIGNPEIKLFLLGKGPLKQRIQELIEKFDLEESVIIHDWVPYRNLPKYISMADVCLLPAFNNEIMNEIVPIKLYEYLAMSKPVISTFLRGIYLEFGRDNGIIYINNSKEALDKALELKSKDLLGEIGAKGRQFILANCNWNYLIQNFLKILEKSQKV